MPSDRSGAVAGVVLAAGASTRLGRNKLFLEIEGTTLLRRTVQRVASAGLDPIVVVLGHEAERARAELAGLRCQPIVNPDYALGVNSSLRAGITAVSSANAAVVVLADMPFVTAAMIATLVERYRTGGAPLVISDYAGVNAPPMLYDHALFEELLAMQGEGCGKQVVKRHRAEAFSVSWPEEALTDLDVPEDYARVMAMVQAAREAGRDAR
jgi:molybdenum cofactor cytidylyltransferase